MILYDTNRQKDILLFLYKDNKNCKLQTQDKLLVPGELQSPGPDFVHISINFVAKNYTLEYSEINNESR